MNATTAQRKTTSIAKTRFSEAGYRLPEVARIWNVSVKTARKIVSSGRVAHIRIGRGIRVPVEEANRLLDEGYRPAKRGA
jgi:excisionase family DNA binding protein